VSGIQTGSLAAGPAQRDDDCTAPLDDGLQVNSVSTGMPARRLRGGRSKNKASISSIITDKVAASISSALTDKFADFDKKLGAIEDKITPMRDTMADMIVRQHEEIQRLRRERDEARLHTIVARGKLGEIRRRVGGHSEARC